MTISATHAASSSIEFPKVRLDPPPEIIDLVRGALTEAQRDVTTFARSNDPRDTWKIEQFALRKMKWPPNSDVNSPELQLLQRLSASRTPEGIATARWYAEHGMDAAWEKYLEDYTKSVGPQQARAAVKLLNDTLDMVNYVTQVAKTAAGRKRPYDTDPTLKIALDRPGASLSYPSGHTSSAFAAAVVLGYLMPHRAQEFMDVAMQASFARIYGGVHYPSDVAAGAKLAATIALYLAGTSGVPALGNQARSGRSRRRRPEHAA